MREIKFRAFDKYEGMLYSGDDFVITSKIFDWDDFKNDSYARVNKIKRKGKNSSGINMITWFVTQHSGILMQYTGLKDRNGKEIYEGDIIKHKEWGYASQTISVVRYYDGGFDPFSDNQDNCPYPEPLECEIIGNLHENPELLED